WRELSSRRSARQPGHRFSINHRGNEMRYEVYQCQIDEILDSFDFAAVVRAHEKLDWPAVSLRPCERDLRATARLLLQYVAGRPADASLSDRTGLQAEKAGESLILRFVVTEARAELPGV